MTRAEARRRAEWWAQARPDTDCPFPIKLVLALLDEAQPDDAQANPGPPQAAEKVRGRNLEGRTATQHKPR